MKTIGIKQHIDKRLAYENPEYLSHMKERMQSELMNKVAFLIGEESHELKLEWFEREDHKDWNMMIYELRACVGAVDTDYPRDRVYRTLEPFPIQAWYGNQVAHWDNKNHCIYCGASTQDDERGNCAACGAPRRKER